MAIGAVRDDHGNDRTGGVMPFRQYGLGDSTLRPVASDRTDRVVTEHLCPPVAKSSPTNQGVYTP